MGALHAGHAALVRQCVSVSDIAVCSIFVNPTQFNDPEDFRKYPNRIESDIRLLTDAGAHVLFMPGVHSIYSRGTGALEHYDIGYLETVLEGKYRPGHFQGVCQVMNRLLQSVQPDILVMGQKDYQQCMVVRRLLELTNNPVSFLTAPTVREADGLAMSSRNLRLLPEYRKIAPVIYQTLLKTRQDLTPGNVRPLRNLSANLLEKSGLKVDYFEIADAETLQIVDVWDGKKPLVALAAAFAGEVRLIDNMPLTRDSDQG